MKLRGLGGDGAEEEVLFDEDDPWNSLEAAFVTLRLAPGAVAKLRTTPTEPLEVDDGVSFAETIGQDEFHVNALDEDGNLVVALSGQVPLDLNDGARLRRGASGESLKALEFTNGTAVVATEGLFVEERVRRG